MGTSIDITARIYAGDQHQEVLTWLLENDDLSFDFYQPCLSTTGKTVIVGRLCDNVSISFEDTARTFFDALHERFRSRIALDIQWPDYGERQLIYLGELHELKAIEDTLSEMLDRLGQLEPFPPEKIGELAADLDNLQASIEAIQKRTRAVLQDAWR